ncbi:MAG: aminotransferase class III-fold pyridoxal phosphate-dependent enzyme, partial [Candidatus Geothermincolia bacterium]
TAAVIFETVPATLGIAIPPEGYFSGVRRLCDRKGAVMIIDEVQTGLGRCGEFWSIELDGVVPDILVTGKGLSGGIYPITATIYREHLNTFFDENPFIHVSTFGGAEVGCYAALAVLDILEEEGFLAHVRAMAGLFAAGFEQLRAAHPAMLLEARQRGLMMGLKMANDLAGPLMTLAGFRHGILTIYANNDPSVSQILPPLIIEPPEVERVIDALDRMLAELEQGQPEPA